MMEKKMKMKMKMKMKTKIKMKMQMQTKLKMKSCSCPSSSLSLSLSSPAPVKHGNAVWGHRFGIMLFPVTVLVSRKSEPLVSEIRSSNLPLNSEPQGCTKMGPARLLQMIPILSISLLRCETVMVNNTTIHFFDRYKFY